MTKNRQPITSGFTQAGGAFSSDTEQVTSSFALVRALPIPPPAWSRYPVGRKSADCVRTTTNVVVWYFRNGSYFCL